MRRNHDITYLVHDNQVYGLTKGQYSPTSEQGKKTKTSPFGSVDYPFNPVSLAIGSEATFVAKTLDRDPKHLQQMIKRAADHKGTAFIEVLQNCSIFNDGAFEAMSDKSTRDDNVLYLEHGKPLIFGKEKNKGIKLDGVKPAIVDITDGKHSVNDLLIHDEFDTSPVHATILAHMSDNSEFPSPLGVFRQIFKPTYDEGVTAQIENVTKMKGAGDLEKILFSGNTWEVN